MLRPAAAYRLHSRGGQLPPERAAHADCGGAVIRPLCSIAQRRRRRSLGVPGLLWLLMVVALVVERRRRGDPLCHAGHVHIAAVCPVSHVAAGIAERVTTSSAIRKLGRKCIAGVALWAADVAAAATSIVRPCDQSVS
jgi:hypothetical protein